jgi:hypothetical protein
MVASGSGVRRPLVSFWRARVAVALVLSVSTVGTARATESSEAEALIRQGVELRQQGKDERALPLFQKAYEILQSPRTAGQLGLAEMAVGYWLDSEQHLGAALDAPDHPWVAKNRSMLEQSLAQVRTNIGEVTLDGTPAGATVTANKRPVGAFPLSGAVRVAKGKVDLEVSAPGYVSATRSLRVGGSDRPRLTIDLEKVPTEATGGAPGAEGSPAGAPRVSSNPTAPPPTVPATADDGGKVHNGIAWGLGIAGGAALIGAVVETIVWQKDRNDFNGNSQCSNNQPPNYGPVGSDCHSLHDSIGRAQLFTIVGYVAAGALGAGSAVLFMTEKTGETSGSRLACAPDLGPTFVRCHWSF